MKVFLVAAASALLFTALPGHCDSMREGNVRLSWTNPRTNMDGSKLADDEIVGTEVRCISFTPQHGTARHCDVASKLVNAKTQRVQFDFKVPPSGGEYCFQMRTVTRFAQSDWAGPFCKKFTPKPLVANRDD